MLCALVAGFGSTKGLDSNASDLGEQENMASWDDERPCASGVVSHRRSEMRALHDTFPFDKEEYHRMGGFIQRTFIRHAVHGE